MISWRDEEGRAHGGSLFATFAALARGEAWSFPALRPHQREPWHAFTVQVAAMALIRSGIDVLPDGEAGWRDLLLALTPGQPEAWELVVDDWSRPALLQPPVVAASNERDYKNRLPTPDALDMLVTAKNHDVKQERIARASDEDWLFALVTLQTTEGFLGAGNYGVSRMNGGFASRMSLGVRPGEGGAAAAFRRDVLTLVADARARPDRREGLALLWTDPWDGTRSLDFTGLDELYVEICRRVRLQRTADDIEALAAGSKVARVAAAELKGRTGDPWAPVKADASSSHTPTGAGFGYWQIAQLLDRQKVTPPLLAKPHADDDREGLSLVAAALVRGQGKTEGLHRRAIATQYIEQIESFGEAPVLNQVGAVARRRADQASDAAKQLRRALILLVQGGPEQARLDDEAAKKKVEPWVQAFDDQVDDIFFDTPFWDEAARKKGNHNHLWRERLRTLARNALQIASGETPRTEVRRLQAWARASNELEGKLGKWVKESADDAS